MDSPLITGPHFWVGHKEEIRRAKGPQAEVGSRFLHALGPEAEGTELKIAGWLWWPPVLAYPPPPPGTAAPTQALPGTFQEHFLLFSPWESQDSASKELQGGWSWGQVNRGQGWCEGCPPNLGGWCHGRTGTVALMPRPFLSRRL